MLREQCRPIAVQQCKWADLRRLLATAAVRSTDVIQDRRARFETVARVGQRPAQRDAALVFDQRAIRVEARSRRDDARRLEGGRSD